MTEPLTKDVISKCSMEFIGTAILVSTIQLALAVNPENAAIAVVSMLVGLIYMGFDISGAHYNPAVTLTVILRGVFPLSMASYFFSAQVAGGTFGAWVASVIVNNAVSPAPGPKYTLGQALASEMFFTTILCFAVLTIFTYNSGPPNVVFGSTSPSRQSQIVFSIPYCANSWMQY